MSLPFLVTFVIQGSIVQLQVFKVPTDKDIGTDPSLLRSINIEGDAFNTSLEPFYSTLVVGVFYSRQTDGIILYVFEKAKLLDASVLLENVEWREVKLGTGGCLAWLRSMNTTSLVYIKRDKQYEQFHRQSLVKRDFWMSNSKSE